MVVELAAELVVGRVEERTDTVVVVAALMNAVVAIPAALLFTALEHRIGTPERADW